MTSFIWQSHYDEGIPTTLEPYPERTIVDYLAESARQWPRRPFLEFKGAKLSYSRLDS
jgi:long-chain acyl-CoA synthetase